MKGGSHLLIGYAAVYTAHRFVLPLAASPVDWLLVLGAASIGALLPDVDSDESAIRQATHTARSNGCLGRILTPGISFITGGHRKFTHSLAAWGLLTVLALMSGIQFQTLGIAVALSIGYLAHLLADALTVHGVPLLWPSNFDVHLLPRSLRIRTGSFAEYAVIVALGVGMMRLWMNA
ncbi:MAG TPA: metal-dependent hydrolase [Anaerolineae bacterium]